MEQLLLGIDVGTTSIKASLYTIGHRRVKSVCRNYQLHTPEKDWVEFSAEAYWKLVCGAVQELMQAQPAEQVEVRALSLSCQGETLLCLDQNGTPLREAIVWLDNRASEEAAELKATFGIRQVYEVSGQADMLATWPAAKILWLRKHQAQVFAQTAHYMLLADYLVYRMTGLFAAEPNLWASSAMLNIHTGAWWPAMLRELQISPEQLPTLQPSGTTVGHLLPETARQMGLTERCMVVTGALDQTCNMIGCGMAKAGCIMETTGSCLAVSAITDHFIPFSVSVPLTCQNTAIPGQYTVLLWSQSAGMTLKWFAEKFYTEYRDPEEAFPHIDAEAALVPPGCNGLVMLPHLTGAANPEFDSHAKGVFAGITLEHGRAQFGRAVMEAVACMLRRNIDQLRFFGIDSKCIYCAGGGAASQLWLQIKADMTNRAMIPVAARDSACHGAAILAGVGCGIYSGVDCLEKSNAGAPVFPKAPEAYTDVYRRYIALYNALKPYFASADAKG